MRTQEEEEEEETERLVRRSADGGRKRQGLDKDCWGLGPPVLYTHAHTHTHEKFSHSEGVFKSHLELMPRISMKLNALFPPNKNSSSHCLLNTNSRDPFFLQHDIARADSFYL